MDANELLKKIRKIEIKTRGLSSNIFAGEYHSAFKGRGMTFSEVREYQYGDDIRDIDWNVTARMGHPYVKVYEEEREMTVMLLVDVSRSRLFGAVGEEKREMIAEIAATIAFSAISNNDKIGMLFFSDKIEKFIPPKRVRNIFSSLSANFSISLPRTREPTSVWLCAISPTRRRSVRRHSLSATSSTATTSVVR